jgi:hypothetical protein
MVTKRGTTLYRPLLLYLKNIGKRDFPADPLYAAINVIATHLVAIDFIIILLKLL